MRILEGVGTLIQLGGLMARLCKMVRICTILVIAELTSPTEHKTRAFYHLVLSHCNKEVLLCTSKQRSEMIPLLIVSPVWAIGTLTAYKHRPLRTIGVRPPNGVALLRVIAGKDSYTSAFDLLRKKLWRPSTGDM